MNREEKLRERIPDLYDMELTPGCRVRIEEYDKEYTIVYDLADVLEYDRFMKGVVGIEGSVETMRRMDFSILGHPLYIGRVMQWMLEEKKLWNTSKCMYEVSEDVNNLLCYRQPDLSLPFNRLWEPNQEAVYNLLSSIQG